jgi:hypothetical protein
LLIEHRDFSGLGQVPDMDDERVEARPALGFVDARDRRAIARIGGQTLYRLGRHGVRLAGRDQPRCLGNRRGSISQDDGVLRAHLAAL